jgi:RND superfamily putative drug exporter
MRTRIIQDDPEPTEPQSSAEPPPPPGVKTRNIAARAGRWSARHRRLAVIGWLVFVFAAFMIGSNVGTATLSNEEAAVGESGEAARIAKDAFPENLAEVVLIQSKSLKTDAPEYRAVIADVAQRLEATKGTTKVTTPDEGSAVSDDGRSALVSFEVKGDLQDKASMEIIDASVLQTKAAQRAHPGFNIEQFGSGSSEDAFMDVFEKDLKKATFGSLPITLILLVLTFGTLVAAGVPLLLAITGVMATMGLVGPLSQVSPVEQTITHVILLIGLAVGVDYALFYLRRMREERAAGHSVESAIDVAAATSGRSVLISGVTVIIAMAGMYLAGAPTFTSFATGTILVVAVAVVGSLTVLPALLSKLGDGIERGRVPGLGRLRARVARIGIWSRILDRVLRRPLLWGGLAAALLVALAIPAIGLDTGTPNTAASLPQDEPVVQTFNRVQEAFPQETSSLSVVVRAADVTSDEVQAGLAKLDQSAAQHRDLLPGSEPDVKVSPDKTVLTVEMEIAGDGTDERSKQALDVLRSDVVPPSIGAVDGVQTYVGGGTAQDADFNDTMASHIPYVFAFVLSAAFLLLLVTFRSIVVPIKAIVLNLLSVAAAYGVMVLVFQHGWGKSLLGFTETGPIESWIPLFMFVVLFGLSMDYHVFILSRVREAYDNGMKTEDAVSYAIKNTAGVVTSAAVVMVAVFAIFGSLSFIMFKQMGVGLAFAVLIDATLIRGVLLPASMKLLGDRNWWLPRSLGWIPQIDHEGTAEQPAAA